eukprot:CAMPEP_0174261322 /NCGR_PEP_ID=MMETSP0439-20130205/11360_1 /TAXON_ID=0 /ORGANISM="Stereomyxa ramosa, Strain Chinc5" /LENGTH=952 /DNA_ID=CAMNT_0015345777 /DNA_START=53 /DNA_END=2911 /DNA_ORIENTATION=+
MKAQTKKRIRATYPSIPSFDERRFRIQVDSALSQVKTILENARNPQYPEDVSHKYQDKYLLATYLTNTAFASQLTCLQALGLSADDLLKLMEWASTRSVTLCLTAEEYCKFDHEETREVESPTKYVKETKTNTGKKKTATHKVVTTVTDYFWQFDCEYQLFAYRGNDFDDRVSFQSRKGKHIIKTGTKSTPRPVSTVRDPIKVNITFLLQNLSVVEDQPSLGFTIDREDKHCRTPRRNTDIENALVHFSDFYGWCGSVHSYFSATLFPAESDHNLDLSCINDKDIFAPIVPLFEETTVLELTGKGMSDSLAIVSAATFIESASSSLVAAPMQDINLFLNEEQQTLERKLGEIAKVFPDNKKVVTVSEANLMVVLLHARTCSQHFSDGINYIESMLRKQLVSAIGKEVGPKDFAEYMRYHQRKVFKKAYQPRAFSYAIRRPEHSPEGVLSIEANTNDGEMADPIYTIVRHRDSVRAPMSFTLDASTTVQFYGDRYLHAYVSHQFAGESASTLQLCARARQFSSFILLVGTVISATQFDPKYGIIIQNKDDLTLPLLLETIPTPKEFRDAIESLSPEQQRFAKAYRSMQLAGTLFGVCIIQIKPQLEKVLNLPEDSLTKEIALGQDLMELFIKYNVPSDLLSFDIEDDPDASKEAKICAVKRNVEAMKKMIQEAKDKELAEQKMVAEKQRLELKIKEEELVQRTKPTIKYRSKGAVRRKKFDSANFAPQKKMAKCRSFAPASIPSPSASVSIPTPTPAPAPTPTPTPTPTATETPAAPETPAETPSKEVVIDVSEDEDGEVEEDYTLLPTKLDQQFEALDEDSALRPTIIKPGTSWTKKSQKGLLSKPTTATLSEDQQKAEKNQAFDLLDGLTKAGCLAVDHASLHVVIAATHCFDKSLMDTVIVDNVNPIEKVERSNLIVATTIQNAPPAALIKDSELSRVQTYSPVLFALEN